MTSGLPQEADIFRVRQHVSNVPKADAQRLLAKSRRWAELMQ
jgi:hypothetical protein